jgi:NADH-quinone oxidoreductase subunit I
MQSAIGNSGGSMFGSGLFKGMSITLKHFFDSYKADRARGGRRYFKPDDVHAGPVDGFITIQYPEEKLKAPENFRFFPVLIRDSQTGEDMCTACGICARVCPPQCIWIVRAKKDDGKPEPKIEKFWIDTSICMQCGYCAEYCPFDAIKMDHRFELSTEERWNSWIHDVERLTVTTDYYAETHPRAWAIEKAARDEKAAKKGAGGRASKQEKAT